MADTGLSTTGPLLSSKSSLDSERNPETENTPRNVTFAGTEKPSNKEAASQAIAKEDTHDATHDEHLNIVETVKSAAHAAKERFHLDSVNATGPAKFFNPTNVRVRVKWQDDPELRPLRSSGSEAGPVKTVDEQTFLWRSRDNRKGRNSVAVPSAALKPIQPSLGLRIKGRLSQAGHGILRMVTVFAYWDMAWWSGWSYSIGSILFVMDGSWAWREEAHVGYDSENLSTYGGPVCFFIGALLYQLGATMAYLEAVNDGSFQGSAMARLLEGHDEDSKKMVDDKIHAWVGHVVPSTRHVRQAHKDKRAAEKAANEVDPEAGWNTKDRHERPGSIYPNGKAPAPRRGGLDMGEVDEGTSKQYMTWRWYPSWHVLRTHHIYEIGYVACTIQLFGATLYGITGVVVLPGIFDSLANWQAEGAFWVPQIVASCCFLTAGIMFTLETQEKWYRPEVTTIGWWIGAWAVIGSIGFLLIACFGTMSYDIEWGQYQADLGTIYGSGAYLTSSLLQWYEAVNKREKLEFLTEPGEMKSYQIHPI